MMLSRAAARRVPVDAALQRQTLLSRFSPTLTPRLLQIKYENDFYI
jgi:hypothetical protein